MTSKLTNDFEQYTAEYDRLYEMYDQDPQAAVYDVMDLMSEIKDLKTIGTEMYAILKELELLHLLPKNLIEKIRKQLKTK
tara:strand:- start:285 stop:524 length:240 start_codon:yes stop_codon:yes gene_type:complete